MRISDEQYLQIRQVIEKRFTQRREFFSNLIAFLVFTCVVWIGLQPSAFLATLLFIATGAWAMGVLIQGMQYIMFEMQEKAIAREVARLQGGDPYHIGAIKAKRHYELSDDGELHPAADDEDQENYIDDDYSPQKRQR